MIDNEAKSDPIDVLKTIRKGRPGLVEDTTQFNFALKVFEEVVFADKTSIKIDQYEAEKATLLKNSKKRFTEIRNVPSYCSYQYTDGDEIMKLNRNKNILPTDEGKIYLEINHEVQVNTKWVLSKK